MRTPNPKITQASKALPYGLAGLALLATGVAVARGRRRPQPPLLRPVELAPLPDTLPDPAPEREQQRFLAPGQTPLFDPEPGMRSLSGLGSMLAGMRSNLLGVGLGQGSP